VPLASGDDGVGQGGGEFRVPVGAAVGDPAGEAVGFEELVDDHRGGAGQAAKLLSGDRVMRRSRVASGRERWQIACRMAARNRSPEFATPPPMRISEGLKKLIICASV
jgi:hypothetical protein